MEFETETVKKDFNNLFKQAFPNGCSNRQKADLMSFFFAGFVQSNSYWGSAIQQLGLVGAPEFMNEINQDTLAQLGFIIDSMNKDDYSHDVFQ